MVPDGLRIAEEEEEIIPLLTVISAGKDTGALAEASGSEHFFEYCAGGVGP